VCEAHRDMLFDLFHFIMIFLAHCRLRPFTPRSAEEMRAFLTDTLWNEYFRFTKDQFFDELLPVLNIPEAFSVCGCVYLWCSRMRQDSQARGPT
jgi:hypothetical protein